MPLEQQIRAWCHKHQRRLKRYLGQHFLRDERVLQIILETADIQPSDHIVEIGAGIGILTKELMKRAATVTAIELDQRLIPLLYEFVKNDFGINEQQPCVILNLPKDGTGEHARSVSWFDRHTMARCSSPPFQYVNLSKVGDVPPPLSGEHLTIIQGDALQVSFPNDPYKIVANIPYEITSPLLERLFLKLPVRPIALTLLLQREVAQKLTQSPPGSRLAILVQLFGSPRLIHRVPPRAFIPRPSVESAIIHIACFKQPRAKGAVLEEVLRLTHCAFTGKRKMLRNTIGKLPRGMERLQRSGIAPERRPENLSLDEWIALAKTGA